jgi:BirA family biotin operon repressor/biotin-[acetyl-CoA-carboxylase] ligase
VIALDTCQRLGWTLETVASTGSTNADLVGRTENGLVLVATEQTAGRGRLDRSWVSAPGDGLTFSVRLGVPSTVTDWGWIPLLAGLATAEAVASVGARDIGVKWPNDVVGGSGKLAGILSARDGDAVIVGIGLNLAFGGTRPDPNAVSVAELGGNADGDAILAALLENLHTWWQRFTAAAGDARRCGLARAYLSRCVSVGVDVQVSAGDSTWVGHAQGIDDHGRLLVTDGGETVPVTAGDVTLRA